MQVGYHLLSLGEWREAVRVFELVLVLAPAEPHSHIDLALAKLQRVRQARKAQPHGSSDVNFCGGTHHTYRGSFWMPGARCVRPIRYAVAIH